MTLLNLLGYSLFLAVAVGLVLYVGNACYCNGKLFIHHYFYKDIKFANTINKVLRTAYYVLNIGMVVWTLQTVHRIDSYAALIEMLTARLSFILLVIGVLHFINMITIYKTHNYFKNRNL